MEKYINIARKIVTNPDDLKQIRSELNYTYTNPDKFIENNERELNKENDLLWFILVDFLIDKHYAFEVDWKATIAEIESELDVLLDKHNLSFSFDLDQDTDELDAGEILAFINPLLKRTINYILVNLDIDSDSYVTVIVTKNDLSDLEHLDKRITVY